MRGATIWSAALVVIASLMAIGCDDSRAPAAPESHPVAVAQDPVSPATESAVETGKSEMSSAAPPALAAVAAPTGTQNITFDTLKFPLEKNADYERSKLTSQIEALHGHTVKLRGYILPSFQQSGLTQFVLVRDNMQCCFGPGAALYDCVVVDMKPGKTTDFTVRPVAVEGTFEVRDFKGPDGNFLAIYHLDGDAVRF